MCVCVRERESVYVCVCVHVHVCAGVWVRGCVCREIKSEGGKQRGCQQQVQITNSV
jgi:hypothetical protein